jgi:hypothetical protein
LFPRHNTGNMSIGDAGGHNYNQGVRAMRFAVISLACLMLLATCGCGSGDPFSYTKVSGKVTYEDGSPIPTSMRLNFVSQEPPKDAKTFAREGQAIVGKDGTFDFVTTHKYADGIVRGKHKVLVVGSTKFIPEEYQSVDKTPLTVDASESPFHLKIRKP